MVAFTWQIEESEMDKFEEQCEKLQRLGYWVHLNKITEGWECELGCGVDVMESNLTRPRAWGQTAMEALAAAVLKIPKPKAKTAAGSSLVAGLPRSN